MKRIVMAAMLLVAMTMLTPLAQAQCPSSTFVGTWVFSVKGFQFPVLSVIASAGRFVASEGADRPGLPVRQNLTITASTSITGSISRLETDATGRFQLFPNCSGGTLTANLSGRGATFEFFFVNQNEIVLVGNREGDILTGSARRFNTGA